MRVMALTLTTIAFDCANAERVATFWAAALGGAEDAEATAEFASITSDATRPGWSFVHVPEPKSAKNRVHLDLGATDREAEVERLVELGARRVADHTDSDTSWTVLLDVEGNEFCVV